MMGGVTTRDMWSSLQKYNKMYIVASCWTITDKYCEVNEEEFLVTRNKLLIDQNKKCFINQLNK